MKNNKSEEYLMAAQIWATLAVAEVDDIKCEEYKTKSKICLSKAEIEINSGYGVSIGHEEKASFE